MYNLNLNKSARENWLHQLADSITDPNELLRILKLDKNPHLQKGIAARSLFPLRVPRAFVAHMKPGDPNDPLLLQVLTSSEEFLITPGFTIDPIKEHSSVIPCLLHKYYNRALLLVRGGCAINCRYCFRRHFPYKHHSGNKDNLSKAITYIRQHLELNEIILSGGDPLMAKDYDLNWLISEIEEIQHIKRLRIHSRLPVVIPARITKTLCKKLSNTRLQVLLVTHINHANEISQHLCNSVIQLRRAGVTILNQSVLLRGINDHVDILSTLSNKLFDAGILPYYLHLLDKVQGASYFMVEDSKARQLMKGLLSRVSGYLVPRLVREISGEPNKIPLDLNSIIT